MSANPQRRVPITPSMERGAIDAGHTGEKVAGFDPATAPMETDAEAGGTATQVAEIAVDMPKPKHSDVNESSHGSAMRHQVEPGHKPPLNKGLTFTLLAVVAIAVIAFLITALLGA